jgi:triosephosphate isomerase (TIM)
MNYDHIAAIRFMQDLALRLDPADVATVDVAVHPPFVDLRTVQTVIEDRVIPVSLGAQHCYHEDQGAFTGEISPLMLQSLGVSYIIVGHSERRRLFGMTDVEVKETLGAVIRHAMTPVLCVGEDEEQKEQGSTEEVLERQVNSAVEGLSEAQVANMVIAYEPIWAIGTGKTASPDDAQDGCAHIRAVVSGTSKAGGKGAPSLRVLYGGSVTSETASELAVGADVDGFLVGGASLRAAEFVAIIRAATPPKSGSGSSKASSKTKKAPGQETGDGGEVEPEVEATQG